MAQRGREPGIRLPYLKAWRHQAFLTQLEIAIPAGVTKSLISYIENGTPTSRSTIRKLAAVFDISPQRLITENPEALQDWRSATRA